MTILNYGITNSMTLLSQAPLSERMKMAALNTVLGMCIVFAVLILIILLISLFKFLPNNQSAGKSTQTSQSPNNAPMDNTASEIISQEDTNLINDHELVAVITAAICAFEAENNSDVSAGGFVVRSIRKVNKRRIS